MLAFSSTCHAPDVPTPLLRACLECGGLSPGTRCPDCRRAKDRARGTSAARGYGAAHQAARRALSRQLPTSCAYGCGTWLTAEDRWHAAHVVDGQPEQGYVISCGPCNLRAQRKRS